MIEVFSLTYQIKMFINFLPICLSAWYVEWDKSIEKMRHIGVAFS